MWTAVIEKVTSRWGFWTGRDVGITHLERSLLGGWSCRFNTSYFLMGFLFTLVLSTSAEKHATSVWKELPGWCIRCIVCRADRATALQRMP